MRRLILLAGPPCSGKSVFLEKIKVGKLTVINNLLLLHDYEWTFLNAHQLKKIDLQSINHLILHYDFIFQSESDGYKHVINLLNSYSDITIMTFELSQFNLLLRNTRRLLDQLMNIFSLGGKVRSYLFKTRLILYNETIFLYPWKVSKLYRKWYSYLDQHVHINKNIKSLRVSGLSFDICQSHNPY